MTTAETEVVRSVRTPIGVVYDWAAGESSSRHLAGLVEGRLIGERCPSCDQVYFPSRACCPRCGVALDGVAIQLADHGTVTRFCIVNVPFLGQTIKIPYVCAWILLDGSDIAFSHLIQECEPTDVHTGMRVEAVWKPRDHWGASLENIAHFRPSGEPDALHESYAGKL